MKIFIKWLIRIFLIYFFGGLLINLIYLHSLRTLPTTIPSSTDSLLSKYHEYTGTYHFHTSYSDGSATKEELLDICKSFDFSIPTDHNTLDPLFDGVTQFYNGSSIIPQIEISTPENSGHFTVLGNFRIDTLKKGEKYNNLLPNNTLFDNKLIVLAHPFHQRSSMNWEDFSQPFNGIEIWNYDVMWRENLKFPFRYFSIINGLLLGNFYPWVLQGGITYPYTEMNFIDTISGKPNLLLFAGTDTHAKIKLWGDHFLKIPKYSSMLDMMTLHILTTQKFTTEIEQNQSNILDALSKGQFFIANDQLSHSNGFRSVWKTDSVSTTQQYIGLSRSHLIWELLIPEPESEWVVRLYKNGELFNEVANKKLISLPINEAAYYRAEVFQKRKSYLLFGYETLQPWIFTQRYFVGKTN